MKTLISTIGLATVIALSSPAVFAGNKHHDRYSGEDTARVIDVDPIYRTVRISNPRHECWDEPRRYKHKHRDASYDSYTSTIAGGIIGGVIGSQFGKGSGKKAMAVAGTLLGGSIGRDIEYDSNQYRHSNNYHVREERCEVRDHYRTEERIDGYRVTYKYKGKIYKTRMDHDPGRRIPVEVTVRPLNNHRYY
jgi:uncharacterized protein YcfJ